MCICAFPIAPSSPKRRSAMSSKRVCRNCSWRDQWSYVCENTRGDMYRRQTPDDDSCDEFTMPIDEDSKYQEKVDEIKGRSK